MPRAFTLIQVSNPMSNPRMPLRNADSEYRLTILFPSDDEEVSYIPNNGTLGL